MGCVFAHPRSVGHTTTSRWLRAAACGSRLSLREAGAGIDEVDPCLRASLVDPFAVQADIEAFALVIF